MPDSHPPAAPLIRTVVCPGCGNRFTCRPEGECWCMAESFRLPMPADAATAECLCPDCLRAAAATAR